MIDRRRALRINRIMIVRISGAILLFLLVGAAAAVAAGLFDDRTKVQLTRPFIETPAPTIAIAPLDEALTFGRTADGVTIAVLSYEAGQIVGVPLFASEDAIAFFNRLGYEGARTIIEGSDRRIVADARTLAIPVALSDRHIAAGTNYSDHAEEADVGGGPFLFPKYVAPTPSRAPIPAGDALLDYEVELCLVALKDIAPSEIVSGGLILCNDVTDRATLLREINPQEPQSGEGFTSGKSAEGYLPVGDLFVVPRDLDAFVETLTLQLSVDGAERQRVKASQWIWDFENIFSEAQKKKDIEWRYRSGVAALPLDKTGALPARTMIMGGTPGGTIFKGLNPSAYLRGAFSWAASGFKGGVAKHVVEAHIRAARKSGDYLQPGALVTIEVDRMGALANRVE